MEPRITRLETLSDLTVQRLGNIETNVAVLKSDVGFMKQDVDTLKNDVGLLKTHVFTLQMDVSVIKSNYSTKADIADAKGEMKGAIGEAKAGIIMWVVSAMFIAQLIPAFLKKFGL